MNDPINQMFGVDIFYHTPPQFRSPYFEFIRRTSEAFQPRSQKTAAFIKAELDSPGIWCSNTAYRLSLTPSQIIEVLQYCLAYHNLRS